MIILYTVENCGKCKILELKLKEKNVKFEKNENIDELINMGFRSAPILKVDKEYLDYGKAIKFIKES